MWQDWALGILGIWVVVLAYIPMASSVHTTIMVITGIVIAILGFWAAMMRSMQS